MQPLRAEYTCTVPPDINVTLNHNSDIPFPINPTHPGEQLRQCQCCFLFLSWSARKPVTDNPGRDYRVRRERRWSTAGVNPPGNWFAPPGRNQSSSGGNETAEASGVEGRKRRLGKRAGRNVSER